MQETGLNSPTSSSMGHAFYRRHGKRALDLALVVPGLAALAPALVSTAVLVRVFLGSPVLFVHERPGRNGVPFRLYKFRSMTDARDRDGNLLADELRVPWFGRILRGSSLDELPELFNVLRGEMSLVGPRPLLMRYLPHYSVRQARRHEVRPGITGWAQVNGRNLLTWDERFELDVHYVDHHCLSMDVKILASTLWKVIRREGVQFRDGWSMAYFGGSVAGESLGAPGDEPVRSP